jgi:hypothetical protein
VDDDDVNFLELCTSAETPWTQIAGWRMSMPRVLAQDGTNSSQTRSHIGLSFAALVMEVAMDQREKAAGHTRLAREVQKRNPSGKFKPGHSAAPLGFTDVVVIREGGSDDSAVEEAFRRQSPIDIACHGSAWTPLSADKRKQAQRLEETRTEARM